MVKIIRRLNGVYIYMMFSQIYTNTVGSASSSVTLSFSPPVNGFSLLTRNFNQEVTYNATSITVRTTSGSVTQMVETQGMADINFIGWFQPNASVLSVTFFPVSYYWDGGHSYASSLSLDEVRVYTQCVMTPPPTTTSTSVPSPSPTVVSTDPTAKPTPKPTSTTAAVGTDMAIAIWATTGGVAVLAVLIAIWYCRVHRPIITNTPINSYEMVG